MKFKQIILNESGNLFPEAERLNNTELNSIFLYLKSELNNYFTNFSITRSMKSKTDHGDIDIICVLKENIKKSDLYKILTELFDIKKYDKNSPSILLNYNNKLIHVDFIISEQENFKLTHFLYSFNAANFILSVFAKSLGFTLSGKGLFKIYEINQRNTYILITKELSKILTILGFKSVKKLKNFTKSSELAEFIKSSILFDSSIFKNYRINSKEKSNISKRNILSETINLLKISNISSRIKDSDYFLKNKYPDLYKKINLQYEKLLNNTQINKSIYNGNWIINTFNIKPGKLIGEILKYLNVYFKNTLESVSEKEVIEVIQKKFNI